MDEAQFEESPSGVAPTTEGWFVVNVRDTTWLTSGTGSVCTFEGRNVWFRELGVNLRVLEPGESNGLYHSESAQEDFLVLHGECRLLVEDQERILRKWDFFHSPAGTEHIFVGAGDGPCVIFMTGARGDVKLNYPVSELAARYGASAKNETSNPDEAYADFEPPRLERPSYWAQLPWA